MPALHLIVALVAAQRLAELAWSRRNERRLRARGGIEHGAGHYPLLVVLHAGWLLALLLTVDPAAPLHWGWLGFFIALQVARLWTMASLGSYWTTRVITVPDAVLVRCGPYRLLRHPNYLIVAAEIAVLPLVFGAWRLAVVFSVLNGLLLWHRIRVEDAALAARRGLR